MDKDLIPEDKSVDQLERKVCTLFLKGKCIKDLNCPNLHLNRPQNRPPVQRPKHKSLQDSSPEQTSSIQRQLEINSLSVKYKDEMVIEGDTKSIQTIVINHPITDPDFPYDLQYILIEFILPPEYLEHSSKLLKGECSIKTLIGMLEKSIESLMVVKVSPSIKVVSLSTSAQPAQRQFQLDHQDKSQSSESLNDNSSTERGLRVITNPMARTNPFPMPVGFTQQSWQLSCSLRGWKGISVALLLQMSIQIQCNRCRLNTSFDSILPSSIYTLKCTKCDKFMTCQFFSELMHQTNPNLCHVQFKGNPAPLSISKCIFQFECDQCEDYLYEGKFLNIMHVSNVFSGEEVRMNCRKCHQKMIFSFDNFASRDASLGALLGGPIIKPQRLIGLVVGQPLPEKGTCKHYRKSFRWLRFPCCGKVFPCDICHDEGTTDRHKSGWATRMSCGHCSREVPFSDNKCVCGGYPTDNRSTSFWEGGKGCRNTVTMSRKDDRKYKGASKPASKK